jgi:DNA invertase Pin-like site-specific DNA recombinase
VSIDAQRRALHELAISRGLEVVDEFADAVESGKDEDRPGWLRLIAELKAPGRTWQSVLVLDTSRVARRRLIAMMFEADCAKRGVRIVYKGLPESDPATDMVLRSVLQAFDEYHSLVSRAKGLAGMAENVRQGWRAGGRAPRGYRLLHRATGAVREGAPVTKSTLVVDDDAAPMVAAYLRLRAQGVPRGTAVARLHLPWPASSTQSMDWQALTYAGHTVWGMHAERAGGASLAGEKRRPRAQWQIQRNTHQALIGDDEAEAILRQLELGVQGRRLRASPLLLSGLLVTPAGQPWHSDGCGHYRAGKGRKLAAHRVEAAVLGQLERDLASDAAVTILLLQMRALAEGAAPVDGRTVAGMEKRAAALLVQIGRTVDLAAQLDDPAPVLRRVRDLEHQRAELLAELSALQARKATAASAVGITADQVRGLLRRLLAEIQGAAAGQGLHDQARMALRETLERVDLDDKEKSPALVLHYAVRTGDILASPKVSGQTPARWSSAPVPLAGRRKQA